jgi:hypothetical protein
MHRQPFRTAQRWLFLLASITSALYGLVAVAQSGPTGPTPPPFSASVVASPGVATPGVSRRITISGLWPNGCYPRIVTQEAEFAAQTGVLVLVMDLPPQDTICTQATTSYSLTTEFTPNTVGSIRVFAVLRGGEQRGETTLYTESTSTIRSRYDATGNWYDPNTSGSGLVVVHDPKTTDRLIGTWFVYDTDGTAHWYSIQQGRWLSSTRFEADLLLIQARPSIGNPACAGVRANVCPQRAASVTNVGRVVFQLSGRDTAEAEARGLDGNLWFKSSVIRMGM